MRNRNFTIKATLAAMACTACVNLSAQQKEYPQPEKMTPGMSEYWTPQPKIVTPGDIKTNRMPSSCLTAKTSPPGKAPTANRPNGPFTTAYSQSIKRPVISRPNRSSTTTSYISSGVFLRISPEPARDAATAASSCKGCTKFRYSTATTTKHT